MSSLFAPIVFLILLFSSIIAFATLYLVFPRELTRSFRGLRNRLHSAVPLPGDHRPWFWKGVGGSLGYLIGGPLGLVAGVVFGHSLAKPNPPNEAFETLESEIFASSGELPPDLELDEAQAVFFLTAFAMLAKLTQLDEVSEQVEISTLTKFIDQHLHLDGERRLLALEIFQAARNSESSFEDYALQFARLLGSSTAVLEQMLDVLLLVACSDSRLSANERWLLEQAVTSFGLTSDRIDRAVELHLRVKSDPYLILGCLRDTALEDVRKHYRRLALEYHPDRLIGQGVSSEFIKLADGKFKDIQTAFEQIEREHELKSKVN